MIPVTANSSSDAGQSLTIQDINNNTEVFSYPVNDFLCLGTSFEFRAYEYWIKANEISKLH